MKYLALGLASAVAASSDIFTQIEDLANSVFTPTENGGILDLSPYATFEVAVGETNYTLQGDWHPLGAEEKRFTTEFIVDTSDILDVTSVQTGYWSSFTPEMVYLHEVLGMPSFVQDNQDAYTLTETLSLSGDATGYSIGGTSVLNVENGQSTAEWNHELSTALEITGTDVTLLVDLSSTSLFTNFSDEIVAAATTGPLEVNFSVSGPQTCDPMASPPCNYESSVVYSGPEFNGAGEVNTAVSIRPKAVIADLDFGDDNKYTLVIRSENLKNRAVSWEKELYLGVYYMENKDMPLAAVANNRAVLVIRIPGPMTVATKIAPILIKRAQPWINFAETIMANPDTIPHLVAYFDQLILTFDDELDCSQVVAKSAVESDILAGLLEVDSLNNYLQNVCQQINSEVMEVIQDPSIGNYMEAAREYLRELLSSRGQNIFNRTYGKIF